VCESEISLRGMTNKNNHCQSLSDGNCTTWLSILGDATFSQHVFPKNAGRKPDIHFMNRHLEQ